MKNKLVLQIVRLVILILSAMFVLLAMFTKRMGTLWFVGIFLLITASILGLVADLRSRK